MLSDNEIIIGLGTIVVLGVSAQWIGRRTGIPSLLLLLPAGLLAGDGLGLVDPQALFGDLLTPGVTLLVSLLLFQAATQLRIDDLPREARGSVVRLVSVGLGITFAGACGAALVFLDVPTSLAVMTGAVLVVSGPTVVGPLLDVVRPRHPTGKVLLWEGVTLDPIGATVGVVVLNLVLAADRGGVHPGAQMGGRLALGVAVGLVAAAILVFLVSQFLLTDEMEAAVALMLATGAFAAAEVVLSEAGLFATVAMGIAIANQRVISTDRIHGFGETLEVLIIGSLFVVLGALVAVKDLIDHAWSILAIVATLVLVVRPLTAAISLVGTPLSARDRAMVGWMDPRGIVAASTATQFSATLIAAGFDAGFLLPVTFGVILGTGLVYGLTAKPVARLLGVALPPPRAIGLVGDDPWLSSFAHRLADAGVDVLLVTTEPFAPPVASGEGSGSISTVALRTGVHHVRDAITDAGLAQVVVSVDHGDPLSLLEPHLVEELGRRHVLTVDRGQASGTAALTPLRRTAPAFRGNVSRADLGRRHDRGAQVRTVGTPLPADAVVLASVTPDGVVDLRVTERSQHASGTLIALVDPDHRR